MAPFIDGPIRPNRLITVSCSVGSGGTDVQSVVSVVPGSTGSTGSTGSHVSHGWPVLGGLVVFFFGIFWRRFAGGLFGFFSGRFGGWRLLFYPPLFEFDV